MRHELHELTRMKIQRKRKSRAKPKPKANTMSNKKETKLTPAEEEEQAWLAKQVNKPKADTPAATGETAQREGEEILPPPDPPVVDSPPFPPPTGYEVDHRQKGAQPEATAVRELELLQVGTRGEGPAPEEPEAPPPPEGK
jgi:hypothetical protein